MTCVAGKGHADEARSGVLSNARIFFVIASEARQSPEKCEPL